MDDVRHKRVTELLLEVSLLTAKIRGSEVEAMGVCQAAVNCGDPSSTLATAQKAVGAFRDRGDLYIRLGSLIRRVCDIWEPLEEDIQQVKEHLKKGFT